MLNGEKIVEMSIKESRQRTRTKIKNQNLSRHLNVNAIIEIQIIFHSHKQEEEKKEIDFKSVRSGSVRKYLRKLRGADIIGLP